MSRLVTRCSDMSELEDCSQISPCVVEMRCHCLLFDQTPDPAQSVKNCTLANTPQRQEAKADEAVDHIYKSGTSPQCESEYVPSCGGSGFVHMYKYIDPTKSKQQFGRSRPHLEKPECHKNKAEPHASRPMLHASCFTLSASRL